MYVIFSLLYFSTKIRARNLNLGIITNVCNEATDKWRFWQGMREARGVPSSRPPSQRRFCWPKSKRRVWMHQYLCCICIVFVQYLCCICAIFVPYLYCIFAVFVPSSQRGWFGCIGINLWPRLPAPKPMIWPHQKFSLLNGSNIQIGSQQNSLHTVFRG